MFLATNLQYLRKHNGNMTQERLAERMGVSRQTVSKWESGESTPELGKLMELCDLFSCTLDTLLREDLTAQSSPFPLRFLRIQPFRYISYPVISRNPQDDTQSHIKTLTKELGLDPDAISTIGWSFPYLSQEQKQRFGLKGYVSALIIPENAEIDLPAEEILFQGAADYAVFTVPCSDNSGIPADVFGQIMTFLNQNGIKKLHANNVISCFERRTVCNGIPSIDVYIHCCGSANIQNASLL